MNFFFRIFNLMKESNSVNEDVCPFCVVKTKHSNIEKRFSQKLTSEEKKTLVIFFILIEITSVCQGALLL